MLYLKNTLGGLGRSLADSALLSFRGTNRWWKLALYAVMFVLPGGTLGVMLFAWIEHQRARRELKAAAAQIAARSKVAAVPSAVPATGNCQSRSDAAPCRAAAGKQARQTVAEPRA
jgi:hypothetical protein